MKTGHGIGLIIIFLAAVFSCTKEKIVTKQVVTQKPSLSDSLNLILAGNIGSSKNWRVSSLTFRVNGGAVNTYSLSPCALDNTYKFTNNSSQNFIQYEGLDGVTGVNKCNSADSTIVEQGNWAFTNDGKSLVIEGYWFDDLSAEDQYFFVFTALGEAVNVVKLTETSFAISYGYTSDGDTYVVTVSFVKV